MTTSSPQTETQNDKAELIAVVLAQYRSIYDKATDAWKRSQEERMVETVEESGSAADFEANRKPDRKAVPEADPEGDPEADPKTKIKIKTTVRSESQTGDAVYLAKALDAVKAICVLKGLDAPRRRRRTGSGSRPIELANVTADDMHRLTKTQLDALQACFLARERELNENKPEGEGLDQP